MRSIQLIHAVTMFYASRNLHSNVVKIRVMILPSHPSFGNNEAIACDEDFTSTGSSPVEHSRVKADKRSIGCALFWLHS